ncbi:hypothetical protein TR51_13815 [Kitasatospora griseola]|uniref:Uncharacterized protein n=1 Tax=Kitasatospora griseola TaxID=2064 RepID=A0A0D0PRD4_KITGR|nr:hypothetical protein [Kitasatospora griseola]KIQ65099.1 hypothetical protein TR51_13815 [Kitasatospora griseola]
MNVTRLPRTALVGLLSAGIAVLVGISAAPSASAHTVRANGVSLSAPDDRDEDVTWGRAPAGPDPDVTWGQR